MSSLIPQLHEQNVRFFSAYRDLEGKLIESLQVFDKHRGYQKMGYNSLFSYCRENLGMSENQAFTLIRVSRKSVEVPALKEAVMKKEITLSSAKLISSVINKENQSEWIEKARSLTKPALERELVKLNPKAVRPDSLVPLTPTLSETRGVLSEEARKILERVKEIESKRLSRACDLDTAIIAMGKMYLMKNDPVEKAKRASQRLNAACAQDKPASRPEAQPSKDNLTTRPEAQPSKDNLTTRPEVQPSKDNLTTRPEVQPSKDNLTTRPQAQSTSRRQIPAAILHQVVQRDKGRCQAKLNGQLCGSRHFTHIHHLVAWSLGGKHSLDNLITLCAGHHRSIHLGTLPIMLGKNSRLVRCPRLLDPQIY